MKRLGAVLAAAAVATLGTFAVASPASAKAEPILVESDCLTEWYVNPDEGQLLPEQLEDGLLFDGPSLVHHAVDPTISLANLGNGSFEAEVSTGVAPLFKVETTNPYSTLNYVGGGLWWSSKITAGQAGGQGNAQTPAVLAGLVPYTPQTTVFSFGVGYANDAGNSAVVSSITFGGEEYDLTCVPEPTETETAATCIDLNTASVEELEGIINIGPERAPDVVALRPIVSVDELKNISGIGDVLLAEIKAEHAYCDIAAPTTQAPVAATLPVTGPGTTGVIVAGAVLVIGGVALIVLMRKRRDQGQPQE